MKNIHSGSHVRHRYSDIENEGREGGAYAWTSEAAPVATETPWRMWVLGEPLNAAESAQAVKSREEARSLGGEARSLGGEPMDRYTFQG